MSQNLIKLINTLKLDGFFSENKPIVLFLLRKNILDLLYAIYDTLTGE